MFKYVDYSNIKKSGGSREPLRFQSIDPLFYLSSFLYPIAKNPLLKGSGFFPWQKKKGCHLGQPFVYQGMKFSKMGSQPSRTAVSYSFFVRSVQETPWIP